MRSLLHKLRMQNSVFSQRLDSTNRGMKSSARRMESQDNDACLVIVVQSLLVEVIPD